ncbi:hypothetical protein BWQ96_08363 [Gracilariopsis chorda]|uniref:Uncharacterized protein n=1 Tax=Gracilariopsis chorda TaxID=448386 RepID=A0A2V3IIL2_9FLOR|nr:hypothetical protein BWQ96_08363 [Gracilariopsis chorda]|eukprot:PXF41911.1 hypothetical protein BWQ96_08363 [Gracilariopsis chorda]
MQDREALRISVHKRFPALQAGESLPLDSNQLPVGGNFLLTTDSGGEPVLTNGANEQDDLTPISLETSPPKGSDERGPNISSLQCEDPEVVDDVPED